MTTIRRKLLLVGLILAGLLWTSSWWGGSPSSAPAITPARDTHILVLGSGGVLGREVMASLVATGHRWITEVKGRLDLDLRHAEMLPLLDARLNQTKPFRAVSYVFMLAADRRGKDAATQALHNQRIRDTVLPWLSQRRLPFTLGGACGSQLVEDMLGLPRRPCQRAPAAQVESTPPLPYVSLVMAARNDGYGRDTQGRDLLDRLAVSLRYAAAGAALHRVPYEVVLGEYNPAPGAPGLLDHPALRNATVRVVPFPRRLHVARFNRTLGAEVFQEYVGKNVAARAARGEWLLITNPDDVLPPELWAELARRTLHPDAVYRARRLSYESDFHLGPHWERVDYNFSERPWEAPLGFFSDGSGDFTLLHRDAFYGAEGYPEETGQDLHVDSLGLWRFLRCPRRRHQIVLGVPIYHQRHGRSRGNVKTFEQLLAQWGACPPP